MKNPGIRSTIRSLKKILSEIQTYRKRYVAGLLLSAIGGNLSFNILFSFSFLLLFRAGENKSMEELIRGVAFLFIGFLITMGMYVLGILLFETAHAKEAGAIRRKLYFHVIRLPAAWFEKAHSGDSIARLTNDMQALEQTFGNPFLDIVSSLISGIGSGIIILLLDYRFALVIIPFSFFMFLLSSRFISPVKKKSDEVQQCQARFTEQVMDMVASLKVVRIFNISGWMMDKLDQAIRTIRILGLKRASWRVAQNAANSLAGIGNFVAMIFLGSLFVLNGWFSFSTLIAMIQMGNGIQNMFWNLGAQFTALQIALSGAERALQILEQPVEPIVGEVLPWTEPRGETALEIKGLRFSYGGEEMVLDNIDLEVKKGETIAIVGESGSGKSTLMKLINGLYLPCSGSVTVFGIPLNEQNKEQIRSYTAYVPQTSYLFSGTVRENILYGNPEAGEKDIIRAAEAAHAHGFIEELPKSYMTQTGERGALISGGQKQRIAIARAFIKNPPLLLLDEATSSLDSRSEQHIQQAVDDMIRGRTCIVIAHRLSTVLHSDRILVLERGKIVEEGSHRDLMEQNGRYACYYRHQFQ